jgi:hypothetical protein
MDERELRGLLGQVKAGRLSRRAFVTAMLGLGLTAPLVSQMLAAAGVAQAQPRSSGFARRRGPAPTAVVAGPDAPERAFRRGHQGPGRLARRR